VVAWHAAELRRRTLREIAQLSSWGSHQGVPPLLGCRSSSPYFPWLHAQGHSPNAWTVLGAVAHATERVKLMTFVSCPTMRYHPAVVARQAAMMGLGSEENLTEHVGGSDGRR
jgi:alkanesulfonate monooxygenase SsuD/methylene tetrahydromethanopterin reductase-like flavin-dependent oxidoreductase (luciferase family)